VQSTVDTITPGPTPPPIESKTENVQKEETQISQAPPSLASTVQAALKAPDSPVSPISDIDSSRSFSYEAPPPPQIIVRKPTFQESQHRQLPLLPVPAAAPNHSFSTGMQNSSIPAATLNGPFSPGIPAPADSPSPTSEAPKTQFPPRTSSKPAATQQTPQPSQGPRFPFANTDETDFKPLTKAPVPLAPRPITERQLGCYTHHSNFSEYVSRFQRTGCSVCKQSELGVKATCSWCTLQLCAGCRGDLCRVSGRDLRVLLERRAAGEAGLGESLGGGGIIWEEDGE
jgi:hypothetical protein